MKNSLKWTITIFFLTISVIIAGCVTGILVAKEASEASVLAESDSDPGSVKNTEVIDVIPDSAKQEKDKDTNLNDSITVGKQYGKPLVEEGTRNILIIGEDQVSYLYDTIAIASIDNKSQKLKLIMIPRDTYIEYNQNILDILKKNKKLNEPGIFKINYTHHIGIMMDYDGKFTSKSISFLADVVSEKFGVHIDDYIKVKVGGFAKLINVFGGIDINVPYDMDYDDPVQDLHIHLDKGKQRLDGKQAEEFARFRQGYKEDGTFFEIGDPGRKENQINLLKAFIKQHGTLANVNKIPRVLDTLGRNINHSIGFGDMLQTYLGLTKDIVADKYDIESENLDGSIIRINGSSYIKME